MTMGRLWNVASALDSCLYLQLLGSWLYEQPTVFTTVAEQDPSETMIQSQPSFPGLFPARHFITATGKYHTPGSFPAVSSTEFPSVGLQV